MPTIQTAGANKPVFVAAAGANYYRFIGLNITKAAGVIVRNKLVDLSNGVDHFIFDRDLIHGVPLICTFSNGAYTCNNSNGTTVGDELQGGIGANNSTNVALINSWDYDTYCMGGCIDSEAFSTGTGAQTETTFKIYNNLLASSGESWISGGGGQGAGNNTPLATDFEVRQNHSYKPVSWALAVSTVQSSGLGQHPIFKNNGEFKNTNRALVEGNEFENSWQGWQTDQSGFQFLITPKNQNNATHNIAVTVDGAGTISATTGSFPSSLISANCVVPLQCYVEYTPSGGMTVRYKAQTLIPTNCGTPNNPNCTKMTVTPAPPVSTSGIVVGFPPGLCSTCAVHNVTARYNEFRNSKNGIQFATAVSDGGDQSMGMDSVEIHDNLFHGINAGLSNGFSIDGNSACVEIENAEPNTSINTFEIANNTCAIATSPGSSSPGASSGSGFDISLDTVDQGLGPKGYIFNRMVQNNIGPAGGLTTYKKGTLFPGGLYAGLQEQSCSGGTCSWTYTHNVLGLGLWTKQTNNIAFPCTNADPNTNQQQGTCGGPTGAVGIGCSAAGDTCFPTGASFAAQFVSYNSSTGQLGYRGDYHLASTSHYVNIGADVDKILMKTAGVRSDTVYSAANITTLTLPNGKVGTLYTQQLLGAGASDMLVWTLATGSSLPAGLSLKPWGAITGTPTATVTNMSFTVQLMDAAQQYATQALTLTITP
jgi:hypothetical protein